MAIGALEEARRPGRALVLLLALAMVLDHLVTWCVACVASGTRVVDALGHADSAWYDSIVNGGYSGESWAFFPLHPLLAKVGQIVTSGAMPPQIMGALISTALFAAFCFLVARMAGDPKWADQLLAPRTAFGWFCLVYAPASFVLHSNHTESAFLLLSMAAFVLASSGRWPAAGALAGLAALARPQGYLVIVAVAAAALLQRRPAGRRVGDCATFLAVSVALASAYPIFQFVHTGDPLAFMHREAGWSHPTSTIPIYFKTFILANSWQNRNVGSVLHHAFVIALVLGLWLMGRRSWPLSIYVALSLAVMPLQGELVNAFRYGTVLFPALYALGDWVADRPVWLRAAVAIGVVGLNHAVAVNYAINHWAY